MGNVWRSGTTSVGMSPPSSGFNDGPFTFEILARRFWITRHAIWKMGYSEWSTPAGLKLARENLQSRVKEEDSITDVENAIFDFGVMDSLCFLFIDQRVFIGMITKFIKFIELNFSVITRGFDIKVWWVIGRSILENPGINRLVESGVTESTANTFTVVRPESNGIGT
ncbi:hypothetical protein Tco_0100009 [Tanacetum coccineum]